MTETHVCSAEHAHFLDNGIRKLVQNPYKILKPYIHAGMKVADIGCGPGYFTIPIADLIEGNGLVYAYDLQEKMLEKVTGKVVGTQLESRVMVHQCQADSINFKGEVECVLGFYMVHEVPDSRALMQEVWDALVPGGTFIVVEPIFHVSKKKFKRTCDQAEKTGFSMEEGPRVLFSRSVLLRK